MLAAVGVSLAGLVAGPGGRCLGAALALIAGAAAVVNSGVLPRANGSTAGASTNCN